MTPCYNPHPMDKENLRKQLFEEIHSQFESKLREARREKSQLEEEIESASEKWRNERRRLNSEIDRLESKVAEARETRRKSPDAGPGKAADPEEIAKIQAAAEERVQEAAQAFEAERGQFQAEISRLQRGIADLLERSNNPLRANQGEKERFEGRLEEAQRAKRLAEDALLRAKADWEQEKLKLVGETVKLRRPAAEKSQPAAQDDGKNAQLEKKLDETLRSRDQLSAEFEKTKHQLKATHEEFEALALQLERSHKERSSLEKQLRESAKSQPVSSSSSEEVAALRDQLERSQKECLNLERQLRESAKAQAESKAPQVSSGSSEEVRALKDQLEKTQKECSNLERQVREASKAQEKAERELDKARQSPVAAKDAQSAETEGLREVVRETRAQAKAAAEQLEELRATAGRERAALERQLREASAQQEKLSRELDRMQNAAASKEGGSPAVARLKQEYQEAQAEARLAAATAKQQYSADLSRLNEEIGAARKRIQQLENGAAPVAPSQESMKAEITEQLQRQYDERIQAMSQEKTQLADELRSVTAMLEQERQKLAKSNANGTVVVHNGDGLEGAVDSEVERIQRLIADIARVIDDPDTELSTVIRKNVERAELDAYLKGILFSMGRGKPR
ncbi:MAG TPA: hypothetical protein VFE29_04315 [Terriglobia bacterium]|nr:hypothetical protein [Terriglobia bacterium]